LEGKKSPYIKAKKCLDKVSHLIVIDVIYAICIVPNKLLSVIGLNNVSSWKIFWKEQKKNSEK